MIDGSKEESKFYLGVSDIYEFGGISWREIQDNFGDITKPLDAERRKSLEYCRYRHVNDKFVKDSTMALMDGGGRMKKAYYSKSQRSRFFRDLTFDENTGIYVFNEFLTLNAMLPPKDWHWKKFIDGEFRFYFAHHEIQVLSTKIERVDKRFLNAEDFDEPGFKNFLEIV